MVTKEQILKVLKVAIYILTAVASFIGGLQF
jgi:hypothetical protein